MAAEQLFEITAAILLFLAFAFLVKTCVGQFASTDPALESFNAVLKTVEEAERWDVGTSKRVATSLDKGSITVFSKDSQEMINLLEGWQSPVTVKRPAACEKDKMCICLCKEELESDWVAGKQYFYCKDALQLVCRALKERVSIRLPREETTPVVDEEGTRIQRAYFEGGFIAGTAYSDIFVAKRESGVSLCTREC